MAEEKKKIVRVECGIVNGIMLSLFKPGYDDGTGTRPTVADGPGVRLNGPSSLHAGAGNTNPKLVAVTEVDAEWFGKWIEQNKQNPMVEMGMIRKVEDEAPNPTP